MRLASPYEEPPENNADLDRLRGELAQIIPLQPASAKPGQIALMQSLGAREVLRIQDLCTRPMDGFTHPCVMIAADFLPNLAGDEGMIIAFDESDTLEFYALSSRPDGPIWAQTQVFGMRTPPSAEEARTLMRAWQSAPPALAPAPINALPLGEGAIILIP